MASLRLALLEGKVESAIERNPELADAIREALGGLPETKRAKYVDWTVGQLRRREPAAEIRDALVQFETDLPRIERKEIRGYPTLASLRDALGALGPSRRETDADAQAKSEATRIMDDGPVTVIRPNSSGASCVYGRGTKWCIAATKTKNYFNDYAGSGALFYFIIDRDRDPADPLAKLALVLYDTRGWRQRSGEPDAAPIEVFDARDTDIGIRGLAAALGPRAERVIASSYRHAFGKELPDDMVGDVTTDEAALSRLLARNPMAALRNPNLPPAMRRRALETIPLEREAGDPGRSVGYLLGDMSTDEIRLIRDRGGDGVIGDWMRSQEALSPGYGHGPQQPISDDVYRTLRSRPDPHGLLGRMFLSPAQQADLAQSQGPNRHTLPKNARVDIAAIAPIVRDDPTALEGPLRVIWYNNDIGMLTAMIELYPMEIEAMSGDWADQDPEGRADGNEILDVAEDVLHQTRPGPETEALLKALRGIGLEPRDDRR